MCLLLLINFCCPCKGSSGRVDFTNLPKLTVQFTPVVIVVRKDKMEIVDRDISRNIRLGTVYIILFDVIKNA